ncbi:MAG: hypothetical protein E6R04_02640 [Spirochaetes bacterium]|nr:MAG: hypothetical protein E6R04_02640 [Spirochaetota bacterium]
MKITKKQLNTLIQESVKRIVHEMVSGKGYMQVTMHGLELGPVQVSARVIPGRRGTFMSPEEPEEIEVDEFSFQGQSISMDELLERENQIRAELGEPPLSHEELLMKAETAVAEDSIDYTDSHEDDLYDLYIGK